MHSHANHIHYTNACCLMLDHAFAKAKNAFCALSPKLPGVAFWKSILWAFHVADGTAADALILLFSIWPFTMDGYKLGLCYGDDSLLSALCNAEWPSRLDAQASFEGILHDLHYGAAPYDFLIGGVLLLAFGDYSRADRWLTKAFRAGCSGFPVALLRALCRLRYGHYKGALDDLTLAEEGFGVRLVGHRLFALDGATRYNQTRHWFRQHRSQVSALKKANRPTRTYNDLIRCVRACDDSFCELFGRPEVDILEVTRQRVEDRLRHLPSLDVEGLVATALAEDNEHFHHAEYMSASRFTSEDTDNLAWIRRRLALWEMAIASLGLSLKASDAWQRHIMTLFHEGKTIKDAIPNVFLEPGIDAFYQKLANLHTYADFVTPPEDDHLPLPQF